MTTLIGARWKHRKVCSQGVLITRQNSRKEFCESRNATLFSLLSFFISMTEYSLSIPCWCFVGGATPVLIPNTAVKPSRTDGTRKGRVGRRQHRVLKTKAACTFMCRPLWGTIQYMSWASRRRFTYITGIILFFLIVIGGPVGYWYFTIPPTCTDGIENQGETAIDEGGPCLALDPRTLSPHAVLWARSFKVRDGTYTAAAAIQNPNQNAGVASVSYQISLYDSGNVLVAERDGTTFIMPGAVTPVIESRIDTGNRVVAHTYFQFTQPLSWERMTNTASVLSVSGKQLTDTDTTPRLSAIAQNSAVVDVLTPSFIAVIYDGAGNAVAASETQLNRLNAGASSDIVFTWPAPFGTGAARIDIMPVLPPTPAPPSQQ